MSPSGGNILVPAFFSCLRKRFRDRNSGLVTSSFSWASQLSSRVSISSWSNSFCSEVNDATHFALLKLELEVDSARFESPLFAFGAPKKEVMLVLTLDFFASAVGADRWLALRFRPADVAMVMR